MNPTVAIAFVFIGCCSNMIFLEYLIRSYLVMVAYFFLVQVANNASYMFRVSIPLQMIFRAGSMIPSLLLGVLILKKKYSKAKYVSVMLVTMGIAMCTIASANQEVKHVHDDKEPSKDPETEAQNVFNDLLLWTLGLLMLTVALFLTAGMGIIQEKTYSEFGKHPKESLFYNHFLPLPGFIFLASDISHHVSLFNQTIFPLSYIYPIDNEGKRGENDRGYICIRSVFILTTECSALSVTLVVTLRKFVSLILSIFYFHNPFTHLHWIGTALTFVGVILFTEMVHVPGLMPPKKGVKSD
uniref:UDP-xylose and UDP-N-acetylglucosamine transporter n=1 Tax=Magallana gigas TaxID=29159 RepID=K1QXP1_MAGGI